MVVTFHGILNVLCTIIGSGTAIMELNMVQELVSIDQDPLFLVFLELWKSYDTLADGRLLQTLDGYGDSPNMRALLEEFWENQEVVTSQNGYHGPKFRATHGATQGGIASPTIYNVAVNSVVRHWFLLTVEYEAVIHYGLGHAVGWILGIFYADDDLLVSREPEWIQGALNFPIGTFQQVGLAANVAKLKMMTCHPGEIRLGILEEAFGRSSAEEGATYQEWLRRKAPHPDCRVGITAVYMKYHCQKLHVTDQYIELVQDPSEPTRSFTSSI